MSIWGKIMGGAAGLVLGGPLGALLGGVAGHAVDRFRGDGRERDATAGIGFTIGVVVLGAKMAKADGVVTPPEVEAFRRVFHVPPEEEANIAWLFERARRDAAGFEPYGRQLARMLKGRADVLEELLDCLFVIAAADGTVEESELRFLRTIADIFGLSERAFDRLRAAHGGADQGDPHALLGVGPATSDEDIRLRYRELARRHHPDRLVADGMPPEFVEVATRKMAAINAAYDAIRRARGFA